MDTIDVPLLGTLIVGLSMISAAYTLAVGVGAGRGRPHLLPAARWGALATCAFIAVATLVLAYAFQTHDFRIRYVARYSDRSMPWWYLVTSLWGGQDGSLLWWSFLLSGWTTTCVLWMRGRYLELQPWVIATLMSILLFFQLLMLFPANPFATINGGIPADGEGLNPLLQNYWMVIHPPTLYMGFVGWSVPFAFVVAALATGRLHDEWIVAARKWTLMAWLFLSVGLMLGALWSYEELGWGGYWAWDPVENASFMPWLVGTAFLHSVIVQERYGMLKMWNVFLLCLTFIMTIFGTFLTRSGLIASVHSFARSDIGYWFAWYLLLLVVGCIVLIAVRAHQLKAVHRIQSLLSREFAFLLNNWILLAMMVVVLVFTTFPLLSEWIEGQEVTVGPPVYNRWMVPFGVTLLLLAGVGPLISWRKATGKNLMRAFAIPTAVAVVFGGLHLGLGGLLGFPGYVESPELYSETATGAVLQAIYGIAPLACTFSCAFVFATILQEFWRGARVRMRTKGESFSNALVSLVARAQRRYGGYIVHLGIVLMFIGFTGAAYDFETEAALRPGETMEVQDYIVRYDDARTVTDPNKRAVYTDLTIMDRDGDELARVSPAKFIYRTHPEMPTTEVAIRMTPKEDVYAIMSTVDPETERATFRVIVRPLVMWIWIGTLVLIFGTFIAIFPTARSALDEQRRSGRRGKVAAAVVFLCLAFGLGAPAEAQDSSSLHAGTVVIEDPEERMLFERLLCMCGDCQRLTLANCGCGWAETARADLREDLARGATVAEIQEAYRAEYGAKAISIPEDEGLGRAMWAVPVAAAVAALGLVFFVGRKWTRRGKAEPVGKTAAEDPTRDQYDARLDEELRRLEGE